MRHLPLVVFISCVSLPLIAQIQNDRIEGNVQDSSGAMVPGTKVVLINTRTQAKLEAESEVSGFYFFPSLQPRYPLLPTPGPLQSVLAVGGRCVGQVVGH